MSARSAASTSILTFEETRTRLRVGRSTMFRLMKSGELKSFKIGRSLRFAEEDVEEFIARRRRGI
jgi:putative molybdopterin biosynthesis protein